MTDGIQPSYSAEDFCCDCIEDEVELEPIGLPPRYLFAGDHYIDDSYGKKVNVTLSYGMATEKQKKRIFAVSREKGEPCGYDNFSARHCYEVWVNEKLAGLCTLRVSGFAESKTTSIFLKLEAIYLKPNHRGKGLGREICEAAFHSAFEKVLTIILQAPDRKTREFEVEADADLYSDTGQAAICIIGELLDSRADMLRSTHRISLNAETITDSW